MKKIILLLLLFCGFWAAKAQQLHIDTITGFLPQQGDTLYQGVPTDSITITVSNNDTVDFNDTLTIYLKSNATQVTDVLLPPANYFISPGQGFVFAPAYTPTLAHFDDGDNIIVVWPYARTLPNPVDSFYIHVYFVSSTSIAENDGSHPAYIYPNPATDYISIGEAEGLSFKQVRILDALGKEIYSDLNNSRLIPVHDLSSGVYFLELLRSDGKKQSFQIRIVR